MDCAFRHASTLAGAAVFAVTAFGQSLNVKIVDRQDKEDTYEYAAVYNNAAIGTMSAVGKTFRVRGATFTLLLPDGRFVVVNCDSKFAEHLAGPIGNRRSCRAPLVEMESIQVDFNGDKAKLIWPVSIDGKRVQSETYRILGIISQPQPESAPGSPAPAKASGSPNPTPDLAARRVWSMGIMLGAATGKQIIADSPEVRSAAPIIAVKVGKTVYLVSSRDDLRGEGPDIYIAIEGNKVFLMGDEQHDALLLKTVTPKQ